MSPVLRQPARLNSGGLIERQQVLQFSFNGRHYQGYQGDTLASALLANGLRVVARSFKYHRPRGVYSAGEEEPCALIEVGTGHARAPTSRAPMVPLYDGLVAHSQNCWPGVNFDLGRLIDFTHGLWPAGFYNKTFKWPNWRSWETLVRRAAGMGRPLTGPDPDYYEQVNSHCDLLICGGGPAGLLAALAAGRAGARVLLVDQDEAFGGVLNWERIGIDGKNGPRWATERVAELRQLSNVILLPRTTVTGIYDHRVTTLLQRGRASAWRECQWTVRPKKILLATGAIEQGLIFPCNDRPGIMLAGAVRHYLNRYAVAAGRHVAIVTNNDSAYQTVFDLARANLAVKLVVDTRPAINPALAQRLAHLGTQLVTAARISATYGTRGLNAIRIESLEGRDLGRHRCDLLALSGGWSPRLHLLSQARGKLCFDHQSQSFLPPASAAELPAGMAVAGSAAGVHQLRETFAGALRCSNALLEDLGFKPPRLPLPKVAEQPLESNTVATAALHTTRPRQWLDLAHDVTLGDAELAVREGFDAVEHFKRYTTTGMSVDQGKTGNLNAFIALGALTGRQPGAVGSTTFRPPYTPVTLGAIAGRNLGELYAPRRYLPAHTIHQQLHARFGDYGWQRPDCYPRADESVAAATHREVLSVRERVGIFDNSPIGKIEVRGPDAAEFLNRVYMNNLLSLQPGAARYGLMLNENGVIIDDGVCVRLSAEHFLVHSTSAAVSRITAMLEEWLQCEWSALQVLVDDVTSQWANFTIAGPKARDVLQALGTDFDISAAAFPHMAVAIGKVAGYEARVLRVSFSGELSFEINVAARHAAAFLQQALAAGGPLGISLYGIDALMVLRTEKGYLHVGSDTDITSTPDDVGWGQVARKKTSDYIGRRSLLRPANRATDRKQRVGLQALDAAQVMCPGGHLLVGARRQPPATTDGWITSACYSPSLKRHIALAVLRGGRACHGAVVTVCDGQQRYLARVVPPVFYDPQNRKLKG